jgi:hypothetical protein
MAEEVKIVDVAGGPAAEATLQELLKVMKGQSGGGSGSGGGKSAAAASKAQDLYTTSVTRGTKTTASNTKAVKDNTSAFSTLTGITKAGLSGLGATLGVTAGLVTNFGNAVMNATSITELLEAIPVFGSVLGKATGYFDASLNTFRQLSETGAGFGNDMLAMRSASAQAGLSLDQFASMVGNNSERMGLLGASTSQGAARFGKITKQLRSSEAGLLRLGFTQESVNEGFGDYIELMARNGTLQGRSNASLAAGAQSYLTEIDKLSRVTGKSRKELQDEMNQRMAAANYNVLSAKLSGDALINFQTNTEYSSQMMSGAFADAMTDLGDGVAQSGVAQKLASVVPGLADLAEANARGEVSQEEYQRRLAELAPQIAAFADGMDAAGTSALMQEEGFAEMLGFASDARKLGQRQADAAAAEAEQARKAPITEIFSNFGQTIQTIRSNIEEALLNSGVMDTLGTALTGVSTVLTEVISSITTTVVDYLNSPEFKVQVEDFKEQIKEMGGKAKAWVKSIKSADIKAKIDSFVDALQRGWANISNFVGEVSEKGLFQTVVDNFGPQIDGMIGSLTNALIIGITGLFAAKLVTSALSSGVSALFGGGGGGRGGGGGGAGGRAGKGVGQFVGNVGGGVMKGAASGLSAFANPTVLLGAAGLAGVILVIGGAVAGATWLVGKSLPTFADGMKSFETLDGAALVSAGKGMLAVAGGMAAFGAGSAVAGLGNLVGNIADGIGAMFGAEKANPLEQLLEFQKYTIDEAKVTSNANALVAYSTAMAAYGGGDAASGLGSLVGGIADGITGFFGGETGIPYDDIIKFQGYSFDTEKVKANAAAMVAFNEALTSSSSAGASSGVGNAVGAIGDAIAGFFGGKTPFEKVQEFGAMELNAAGVKTNAQAMADMATALGAFVGGEAGEIEISARTVTSMQRLGQLGESAGFAAFTTNLQSIADVTGLDANINSLNSLDTESIINYNTAMKELVEVLGELNAELAKDNKVGFGSGTNAGDVVSKMDSIGGSGTGNTDLLTSLNTKLDTLNTHMVAVKTNTRNTVGAISGNLQTNVSR